MTRALPPTPPLLAALALFAAATLCAPSGPWPWARGTPGPGPGAAPPAGTGSARAGAGGATAPEDAHGALAAALLPLGPAKAIVSAALWTALLQGQQRGDSGSVVELAEALLLLHPSLEAVREHLAHVLAVNEAGRAPDDARHRALVVAGLRLLDEGAALSDSPRLHAALGRLLAVQAGRDSRFHAAAREYFGAAPELVAIDELRLAERPSPESFWLAQLLLERGEDALRHDADLPMAARHLSEAEDLLREFDREHPGEASGLLEQVRRLQDELAARRGKRS